MTSLDIEESYKVKVVAGIDEVGRGPLSGPVIAAAVIVNPKIFIKDIKDSKMLSAKKREKIASEIKEHYLFGIGEASVAEIDEVNIYNATKLAMMRAAENLPEIPEIVLVDGNMNFADQKFKSIIKGDNISRSIAAASIVAKVHRDCIMKELSLDHPEYGWEKNVGYATKTHISAIQKYGPTIHHRSKFISNINFSVC